MTSGKFPAGAVSVPRETEHRCTYSFCTLVTRPDMYANMVESFRKAGFKDGNCEFLYVDNTAEQMFDAYSGINRMLGAASGRYVILCHQDLLAIDTEADLANRLAQLTSIDPKWALAGNAGFTSNHKRRVRITDMFGSDEASGPFPAEVVTLDENFIVMRSEARFGCSVDLSGFHMYGPDLATQAQLAGWRAYVIDFHLEHLGRGESGASFLACMSAFEEKYRKALRPRSIKTTVVRTFVGRPGIVDRVRAWNTRRSLLKPRKPGESEIRFMRRLRINLHEVLFGPVYRLDGYKFRIPKDSTYVAKRAIHKGFYEAPERNLVRQYLPDDLPVIELGGSFGIVSRITRARIKPDVPMVVVEANPTLMEYCEENATRGAKESPTTFVNAALGYSDDQKLKFTVTHGIHDSRVGEGTGQLGDEVIEIKAVSLSDLCAEHGITGLYSLVCDIEGMEYDLLENDGQALKKCQCAIIEFHPHIFRESGRTANRFFEMIEELGFVIAEKQGNVVALTRP